MGFSVRPATIADAQEIAAYSGPAFEDNPIVGLLSKNVSSDAWLEYSTARIETRFKRGHLNGLRQFKVVDDETGKTVAASRLQCPQTLTAEQMVEKESLPKEDNPYPEGFNTTLEEKYYGMIEKFDRKYVDSRKDYALTGLAVSPEYQRRGLGSLLLRHNLAIADKAGARTWLGASPAGLGLYLKHGFTVIDELSIDTTPYGGNGVASEKVLVREPNAQED